MPRKRQPKFVRPPGFKTLTAEAIPRELFDRGWKAHASNSGFRNSFLMSAREAFVEIEHERNWDGDIVPVWVGYSAAPQRKLRRRFQDPISTMRAIEECEACGPLANCWEDQDGAPERDGWTHVVRRKCDVWHQRSSRGAPVIVAQTPAFVWFDEKPRYGASIDLHRLTNPADGSEFFLSPIKAMEAVEFEMGQDLDAEYWKEVISVLCAGK